jgi:hypothetical protein
MTDQEIMNQFVDDSLRYLKVKGELDKCKAALKFYADGSNWCDEGKAQCHWTGGQTDGFKTAREALKGLQDE